MTQIIAESEEHFRKGKASLEKKNRNEAREEFDRAVDAILESGFDVRASQRLQTFYLELVERIYREEVPMQHLALTSSNALVAQNQTQDQKLWPPQVGFREQTFEPSTLDDLSHLLLTPEESSGETATSRTQDHLAVSRQYKLALERLLSVYKISLTKAAQRLEEIKKRNAKGVLTGELEEAQRAVYIEEGKVIQVQKKLVQANKQIAAIMEDERAKTIKESLEIGPKPAQLTSGQVPAVVRYLYDNLNDPYTMRLLTWSDLRKVYLYNRPYWYVTLRTRAKNGFGAYILKQVGFYLRRSRVVFVDNL